MLYYFEGPDFSRRTRMDCISDELATIDLGDKRLDRRALLLAERLASSPTKSIPAACHGWAETQAAYRLFDQEGVDAWSILEPHILCTEQRMRAQPVVLCLQDTTSLDYNGQDIEGLGPIQYEPERGLFLHPTYTVTPAREPLGILDCWSWARKLRGADGERPADIPESQRWIDGYERVAEVAATMPETRLVYVADREADMLPLIKRARELDHPADLLVRSCHDRTLPDGGKLWQRVLESEPLGELTFVLDKRRGQKRRPVRQRLYAERVAVPDGRSRTKTVELTCVIAREVDAPAGAKPVEWRLLTNRTVERVEQAVELIDWYRARWEVEMYFDILKNGCRVESLHLKTMPRLEVALSLYMIIAWRINRLMRLGRAHPDLDAELLFETEEWQAAYLLHGKAVPKKVPPLQQVVRLIASLSGFLGRKGDGEPGARTIWEGLEQIAVCVAGIKFARAQSGTG